MRRSKMRELLFGTAGIPLSAKSLTMEAGIARVSELGLGCLEVEFVQGVRMSENTALSVGKLAVMKGITLTAHGPYFINLNAREPEKISASRERIMQTARIAAILGAKGVVFHSAFYLGEPADKTYDNGFLKIRKNVIKLYSTSFHFQVENYSLLTVFILETSAFIPTFSLSGKNN